MPSDAIKTSITKEKRKIQSIRMQTASYALQPKSYKFINPQGKLVEIHNLTKFCREHPEFELCSSGMFQVHLEKAKSHKGWTKANSFKQFGLVEDNQ